MRTAMLLLWPGVALLAQAPAIPGATEVARGVFVLRGAPTPAVCAALKAQRITHVVDLRRDDEPDVDCTSEARRMTELGIHYLRYALRSVIPAEDFDFLRGFLQGLPGGSRVLFHCAAGNRAAASVCPWLVLDRGMPLEEALRVAREAGLTEPETEGSVRDYLGPRLRR